MIRNSKKNIARKLFLVVNHLPFLSEKNNNTPNVCFELRSENFVGNIVELPLFFMHMQTYKLEDTAGDLRLTGTICGNELNCN